MSLQAVPTPEKPKLIEQLRLLAMEWGEGFDEDVAAPLAEFVQWMRRHFEAMHHSFDESLGQVEEARDKLSEELEEAEAESHDYKGLFEDLQDVKRGVRNIEEVFDKWLTA